MAEGAPPRAHPDRVVRAQREARRGLAVALVFVAAAPLAALVPHDTGRWLPLHLFLVGGVTGAILGVTQLLAVTWAGADPLAPRLTTITRWALAAGTASLAAGREADVDAVVVGAAALVVSALVAAVVGLAGVARTATTDRFAPALEAYLSACGAGVVGVVLGLVTALGDPDPTWSRVRSAHLIVNLYGFVGLVIAGTLPYFAATQLRARMAPAATPRALRALVRVLAGTAGAAALGVALGWSRAGAAALVIWACAVAVLVGYLPRPSRNQLAWAGPRVAQVVVGIGWWVATTVALAGDLAGGEAPRPRMLAALVVGGLAQILAGSLAYLGPVLRGGGHRSLAQGFTLTRAWPSLVAANVAGVALVVGPVRWSGADTVAMVAVAVWVVDTAVRGVLLAMDHTPTRTGRDRRFATEAGQQGLPTVIRGSHVALGQPIAHSVGHRCPKGHTGTDGSR